MLTGFRTSPTWENRPPRLKLVEKNMEGCWARKGWWGCLIDWWSIDRWWWWCWRIEWIGGRGGGWSSRLPISGDLLGWLRSLSTSSPFRLHMLVRLLLLLLLYRNCGESFKRGVGRLICADNSCAHRCTVDAIVVSQRQLATGQRWLWLVWLWLLLLIYLSLPNGFILFCFWNRTVLQKC